MQLAERLGDLAELPEPDREQPAAAAGAAPHPARAALPGRPRTRSRRDDDARLVADLLEAFGDPLFESHDLTTADVRELASRAPERRARGAHALPRVPQAARESAETLAERLTDGEGVDGVDRSRLPSRGGQRPRPAAHEPLPRARGGRRAALARRASSTRDDVYRGLVALPRAAHRHPGADRARRRRAQGAAPLRSRAKRIIACPSCCRRAAARFQLAHQVGAAHAVGALLDRIVARRAAHHARVARARARRARELLRRARVLMPYEPFLEAAKRRALRHRGARRTASARASSRSATG